MAYSAATRVWYGPESYQWALFLHPAGHTIGTDPALPVIAYRPGGGWAGADIADLPSRGWWTFGLNDSTNATHVDSYSVFVVNTASVGYNLTDRAGVSPWVTATAYIAGNRVDNGGRRWVCYIAHTSGALDDEPGVGAVALNYWRDVGAAGQRVWIDGTVYALGNYVTRAGVLFVCIDAHTASAANDEPVVGTNWDDYWREVGLNETGTRKVADLGECTPGGVDETVLDMQRFIVWLRRNAATYGVNPAKICVAGASAGGQIAGCAAYAEDLAWARSNQIHGASRMVPHTSSRPNAALLSITPVDLVRHTTYELLRGLYGESINDAAWVAREAAIKQAMSPLYVLQRTGLVVPTCLDYIGGSSAGHTAGTAFSGLTGSPYHHPDNGWLMLQFLTAARTAGLATTGHIFFDNEPSPSTVWRSYTTFNGTATVQGGATTPQVSASAMLAWLNNAMGV